jgi:hypothetical protein
MKLHPFTIALVALLANGPALTAADGGEHQGEHQEHKGDALETETVTGTVTAVAADHKSFTLKTDGAADSEEYRPYYKGHKEKEILEKIAKLEVGEKIRVTYTVAEGRRALRIEPAKGDEKKDDNK